MKIAERHKEILDILKNEGFVDVNILSQRFNISSVTIRKDLKLLEEKKLLFRSHGRAIAENPYISENHVNIKEKLSTSEKHQIAVFASKLITPNDHIIIASGTSVIEFARQIKHIDGLTVFSASLDASLILSENSNIDVIQVGGMVRQSSSSVVGPISEKILNEFTFTKLFLGVDGIDLEFGLSTTSALEASLNKVMMRAAQRTIVLADSTKFGRKGFGRICKLEDVDQIITDNRIDEQINRSLTEAGIDVSIA
jgi:DeoR family transcriptional regulator, aga operon transcriptional repressor